MVIIFILITSFTVGKHFHLMDKGPAINLSSKPISYGIFTRTFLRETRPRAGGLHSLNINDDKLS